MEMPKWPATVKGFENLTIKYQPIAAPINKGDPNTYLLNIGTVKHARSQFALSAAKNLYAVPLDILIRIAKVVSFYNILFADTKTPLSQRAISWLTDLGRILISPLSWVIVIIAGLYAAAHPSACARNAVVKLENVLLESDKLGYLKSMTRAEVDDWAHAHQITNPAPRSQSTESFSSSSSSTTEPSAEPAGSESTPTPVSADSSSSLSSSTTEPSSSEPAPVPVPVIPPTLDEQRILDAFTPQMVEALGGVKKVLSIPKLENWQGQLDPKCMTAPVMRSGTSEGVCLLFCYRHLEEDGYRVKLDCLARIGKGWQGLYNYASSEMNLKAPDPIVDGSVGAKYMLEKISRLMQGKAVGIVKRFSNVNFIVSTPKNKVAAWPTDAYLKGDELLDYMDAPTLFYEKAPKAGTTEIFLYDNSKSKQENNEQLRAHFPAMFET